jgi:formylglycine-generating enzyme required for sulfatase activity
MILLLVQTGCNRTSIPGTPTSTPSRSGGPDSIVPPISSIDPMLAQSVINFTSIPGGSARLGSVSSEPGRDPANERLLDIKMEPFDMSTTEITRGQWFPIMQPDRSVSPSEAHLPITNITYYQAVQYCKLLTIMTNVTHRLPTEREWEYACRAGSHEMLGVWQGNCSLSEAVTSFHRGDSGKLFRGIQASCNIKSGALLPVASYKANRFGLFDMHGNCWEWINLDSALGPPPSPLHAPIRGGSAFSTNYLESRAANRTWQHMSESAESIGFRVVRPIER